jgi:hypothetical protein
MAKGVNFTGQRDQHDLFLLAVDQVGEGWLWSNKLGIEAIKCALTAAINQYATDLIEKIITGRAGDCPIRRQLFAMAQDFLGYHVERPATLSPFSLCEALPNLFI